MFVIVCRYIGLDAGVMGTFQYEFQDKIQCESAIKVMEKRFSKTLVNVEGYCQQVRK